MSHVKSDLTEVKADVKTMLGKPGKIHDTIVEKVILVIVGAVVAYLLYEGFGI